MSRGAVVHTCSGEGGTAGGGVEGNVDLRPSGRGRGNETRGSREDIDVSEGRMTVEGQLLRER